MAPVTQYVFAEMLGISEHFTAGSHEWLPYSVIPTFPKLICKQQFSSLSIITISKTQLTIGLLCFTIMAALCGLPLLISLYWEQEAPWKLIESESTWAAPTLPRVL